MRGTPPHTSKDDSLDESAENDAYETKRTRRSSHERQQKMNNAENEYLDEHPEKTKNKASIA